MAAALGLVVTLPSIVASAANTIIRRLLPGGNIECTVSQIGLFQANLAIDARQAPTEPDRPGQRIVKLPHCRITYRPEDNQSTMGAYVGKTAYDERLQHGVMVDFHYADGKDYQPSNEAVRAMRPASAN